MTSSLEQLEPKLVWQLFRGMAAVPRPSKQEERIRAHLRQVAEQAGLSMCEDGAGNLVIAVPASPGKEGAPITVLQAHVDMVCEKNSNVDHDFDQEGIHLLLDTDDNGEQIVRADGTTLGADNGIGVAMALAAVMDKSVVHGPLELLFTTDEEAGMTGAKALTPDSFKGRCLLNLDSEEDDALYIGCAGGCDTNLTWSLQTEAADGAEAARVTVSGLRGGHSGGDIHENRANAIKVLSNVLLGADVRGLRLAEASGGSKRNAIPREAHAVVCGPTGMIETLQRVQRGIQTKVAAESREKAVSIAVEPVPAPACVLGASDTARVLSALSALPNGVLGMSPAVPGLVQTSNNVSTMSASSKGTGTSCRIEVGCLSRSSSAYWIGVTLQQIAAVGRLAGADVSTDNEYPGWEPDVDSPVLGIVRRVYETLFGGTPKVAAIHAGLECGIIGKCVGNMDMVSFGPRIEGAHSPEERVYPESVEKSWKLLKAVLLELAKTP